MWTDKIPEEDGFYWVCQRNFEPTVAMLAYVEGLRMVHILNDTETFTPVSIAIGMGYQFGPKLTPPAKRTT